MPLASRPAKPPRDPKLVKANKIKSSTVSPGQYPSRSGGCLGGCLANAKAICKELVARVD